jgi:hypothetical protein
MKTCAICRQPERAEFDEQSMTYFRVCCYLSRRETEADALTLCTRCDGIGKVEEFGVGFNVIGVIECPVCLGSGNEQKPRYPQAWTDMFERLIAEINAS